MTLSHFGCVYHQYWDYLIFNWLRDSEHDMDQPTTENSGTEISKWLCKGFRSCGKSFAMTPVEAKCEHGGHSVPGARQLDLWAPHAMNTVSICLSQHHRCRIVCDVLFGCRTAAFRVFPCRKRFRRPICVAAATLGTEEGWQHNCVGFPDGGKRHAESAHQDSPNVSFTPNRNPQPSNFKQKQEHCLLVQ